MKEIEDLKNRLKNEMSTRMEDRDIVDILEVLQDAELEIQDWIDSFDRNARVMEERDREHMETLNLLRR